MIRYSLRCSNDHGFESWFASSGAYDGLYRSGHVTCPMCGDANVEKALMTPQVRPTGKDATPNMELSAPSDDPAAAAMAKLRTEIEANSEDVGNRFVAEARAIHDGSTPARSIIGQARPEEARKLVEDGIPIAPLPFIPSRKTN